MAAGVEPTKHRSRWLWVSVALAVVAAGLLVWALTLQSDLDSAEGDLDRASQELSASSKELDATKKELDDTQQEVESAETTDRRRRVLGALGAVGGAAAAKEVYDDLTKQLGATEEELDATQADLEDATKAADDATAEAKAAEREASAAEGEADKAEAETAQAKSEAKAEKATSTVVVDCVTAYVSAFGGLFEGDSVREQAAAVRKRFGEITAECRDALAGA
jgi:peptidoglycan hydrolase CwlO-like protein